MRLLTQHNITAWVLALLAWVTVGGAASVSLRRWHERERAALDDQAQALTQALASSLRSMSGRIQRTEGLLDELVSDLAASAALDGVALVDADGRCVAVSGMPEAWDPGTRPDHSGVAPLGEHVVAWQPLDLGQRRGMGWGGGFSRDPDTVTGLPGHGRALVLFGAVPTATLKARWRRDHTALIGLWIVLLGAVLALATVWHLARTSLEYRSRLAVAAEERRALEEVNTVAAGLAHEVKNPLGVIRGHTQRLLANQPREVAETRALRTIMEEIDRITSRINELLAFARTATPHLATVNLFDMLTDIDRLIGPELAEAGLCLGLDTVPRDLHVEGDTEQLRRLLFNLVHNALRFAPGSGEISVAAQSGRDGRVTIRVSDSGPGIPPEVRNTLFSAYVTTHAQGTGMGLAVVRRVAQAHGWAVTCPNTDGGATFEVSGITGSTGTDA